MGLALICLGGLGVHIAPRLTVSQPVAIPPRQAGSAELRQRRASNLAYNILTTAWRGAASHRHQSLGTSQSLPLQCSAKRDQLKLASRRSMHDLRSLQALRADWQSMLTVQVLAYKNALLTECWITRSGPSTEAIEGSPPLRSAARVGGRPATRPGITLEEQGGMQ